MSNELRCSAWMRADGADPIGTAAPCSGYLLVEWPMPWPRDIGEVPELAPVVEALAGSGIRLQGIAPERDKPTRTVALFGADPAAGFRGYAGCSLSVEPAAVVDAALALLSGREQGADLDDDVVLVCGHGKRDTCCGSLGTVLFGDLAALPVGTRAWRTSHTGGHRFAPTVLVLPQGTMWAFADLDLLGRVVGRTGPLDDLLPRYRGCSGLGAGTVQALEREAFREVGWAWLDWRRRGTVVDAERGLVRLDAESPDGELAVWEGTVEVVRQVPVPECGLTIDHAKKSEPELRVTTLDSPNRRQLSGH